MEIPPVIQIVPYDPNWPKFYEEEAEKIKRTLGDNCITIHHIGSTSVPGLDSKPIIDIIVVVKDLLALDADTSKLHEIGYIAKGEYGIPFRRFFHKGSDFRTHHVHAFEEESPEIERHLHFRDYLKKHPEARLEYAQLKHSLAKLHPHDTESYTDGKEAFIHKINQEANLTGLRLVQARTSRELAEAKAFRHTQELEVDQLHILLLQGTSYIGYALIQNPSRKIGTVLLAPAYEHLRPQFMALLERWIALTI